jgi:bifunctional UDP-N-acetylglucosamine pyrophosphorylase/glucosamine-1-phosphate N-acetyltransferase
MNILILAAGKGTRMKSPLPKVLHPVGGVPMLGHVLHTARKLHPKKIIVVIGHGADAVKQAFADDNAKPSIHWVLQDPPLGTGHAVQQAAGHLLHDVPTLVLYGDVPLVRAETLARLADAAGKAKGGMALLTAVLDDPHGYGRIVRDPSQGIIKIVEEKDADAATRAIREINTGMLVAPTADLKRWVASLTSNNAQGEFYLTDVVAMAAAEAVAIGSCQPESEDEILGINSQAQRTEIERLYQQRIASHLMAQGVRLIDADRIDVRGELSCESDVSIDVNCVFEGQVTLGRGAVIGPNCVLKNCEIGPDSRIEAFTHIEDARVGPQCTIGPYARLRPGTELEEGAHVGNFVEIKNSRLGPRSKANHLSYLGDATIGSRVNIGAGTITCNYDGAEKHRTVIEDDAFIGSDTQLVAPVTVGKGATLGAGTTLTHDAPPNELTLSRTRQVTVKGYKRPHKKAH